MPPTETSTVEDLNFDVGITGKSAENLVARWYYNLNSAVALLENIYG